MQTHEWMRVQMMHAASSGCVHGTHSDSSAEGGRDILTTLSSFLKNVKKSALKCQASSKAEDGR